jgi:hypothetical protein
MVWCLKYRDVWNWLQAQHSRLPGTFEIARKQNRPSWTTQQNHNTRLILRCRHKLMPWMERLQRITLVFNNGARIYRFDGNIVPH